MDAHPWEDEKRGFKASAMVVGAIAGPMVANAVYQEKQLSNSIREVIINQVSSFLGTLPSGPWLERLILMLEKALAEGEPYSEGYPEFQALVSHLKQLKTEVPQLQQFLDGYRLI